MHCTNLSDKKGSDRHTFLGRSGSRYERHQARDAGEVPVDESSARRPDITEVAEPLDQIHDVVWT